jgi:hypothetical protein
MMMMVMLMIMMMLMIMVVVVVVVVVVVCSQAHSIQRNHTTPQEPMLVNGIRILLCLSMNWCEGGTRNQLHICQNYDCLDLSGRCLYLQFPRSCKSKGQAVIH